MESTVSISGIDEISSLLRKEINKINNTYTRLIDEINVLTNNINALKECNGTMVPATTLNNQPEQWKIEVTGYENCSAFPKSTLHMDIMNSLDSFNLEPSQMSDISSELEKHIKSIEKLLDDSMNLQNFNKLMNNHSDEII